MRLTAEENPEAIARFRHLTPASPWVVRRCGARLQGTRLTCSRAPGHRGPHAAHDALRRLRAVWDGLDEGSPAPPAPTGRPGGLRRRPEEEGLSGVLTRLRERIARHPMQLVEEGLLLLFAVAMVGFVIDWLLRIIGAR